MALAMPVPMAQLMLHIACDPRFFTFWTFAFVGAIDDGTKAATVFYTGEQPYRSICVWHRDQWGLSYIYPVPEVAWFSWVQHFYRGLPRPHYRLRRLPPLPPPPQSQPLVNAANTPQAQAIRPIAGKPSRVNKAATNAASSHVDKENHTPSTPVPPSNHGVAHVPATVGAQDDIDKSLGVSASKSDPSSFPMAASWLPASCSGSPANVLRHGADPAASLAEVPTSPSDDFDRWFDDILSRSPNASPPTLKRPLEDMEPPRSAKRTKTSPVATDPPPAPTTSNPAPEYPLLGSSGADKLPADLGTSAFDPNSIFDFNFDDLNDILERAL